MLRRTSRSIGLCLALTAIVVIAFAPVRHHEFLFFDDPLLVTQRPEVLRGLTWPNVGWALTNGLACYWQPVSWLSHMLDVQLFGLDAGAHHLTNVVIHGASTLLLFWLLQSVTGGIGQSAFVAALFAVHPLHVESVAWVAERRDVLSAFFWMLTLWAYASYARRPGAARYLAVVVLFLLGIGAKPMVVTLPFVLLLLDVWPLGRGALGMRLVWEKLPLFALSTAGVVVTMALAEDCGILRQGEPLPLGLRLQNALLSYVAYVAKMFWPTRLAAFYPYPASFPAWQVVGAVGLLGGMSCLAWALRRHGYVMVGWLWYLGTLVPVIGLVQAGKQAHADRFTYIPLIGLFLILAWGIPDLFRGWPRRRLLLPIGAAIVTAACTVAARDQVGRWRNDEIVWERALAVTTGNDLAHNNLGMIRMSEGREEEAIVHFTEALRIQPANALAHSNLGWALSRKGQTEDARAHYEEALRIDPEQPEAHFNLGLALAKLGKGEDALSHLEEAVRVRPDRGQFRRVLGRALAERGRIADAIVQFEEALGISPDDEASRRALVELRGALRGPNDAASVP